MLDSEDSKDGMALSRAGKVDHKTIGNDRQRGKASSEHRRHKNPNGTALETQEANQNRLKRGNRHIHSHGANLNTLFFVGRPLH